MYINMSELVHHSACVILYNWNNTITLLIILLCSTSSLTCFTISLFIYNYLYTVYNNYQFCCHMYFRYLKEGT